MVWCIAVAVNGCRSRKVLLLRSMDEVSLKKIGQGFRHGYWISREGIIHFHSNAIRLSNTLQTFESAPNHNRRLTVVVFVQELTLGFLLNLPHIARGQLLRASWYQLVAVICWSFHREAVCRLSAL